MLPRTRYSSAEENPCAQTLLVATHSPTPLKGGAVAEWVERWLALATGRCGTGSNPTADNFASELWQFRLPRFASVFRRRD